MKAKNNSADIQRFLDLTDRVTKLENIIVELETRIDWMENYDKKNNDSSINDDTV